MITWTRSKLAILWFSSVILCTVLTGGGMLTAQRLILPASIASGRSDVDAGAVPASQMLTLTVRLKPVAMRLAALDQLLAGQMTAGSPSYRQWVTPTEFAAKFGPTDEEIEQVRTWLESQGLEVSQVSASRLQIRVTGSSSRVAAAFEVELRQYRTAATNGVMTSYFATTQAASIPKKVGAFISGISGLDDRPVPERISVTALGASGTKISTGGSLEAIEAMVQDNAAAALVVVTQACVSDFAAADVEAYTTVLRQAQAQGITVLATNGCGAASFPASLAEATAVTAPTANTLSRRCAQNDGRLVAVPTASGAVAARDEDCEVSSVERPAWQFAQGLPYDNRRAVPDVTADVAALAQTLAGVSVRAGTRLGNVAPVLYALAKDPGLYTQPDDVMAGTWEDATGLGVVDLKVLANDFPQGTIGTSSLLVSSTFAPAHGSALILTATVTSTGGSGIPTGTVTFTSTQKGPLGTAVLNAMGVATFTTNQLAGGTYTTTSVYGGDATYTGSTSGVATITVVPEVSMITATVAPGAAVGGSASIAVSVTSASGVGTPGGTVTVSPQGTKNTASATGAVTGTSGTASGTVLLPVYEAGEFTLLISCTDADPSYSCDSPIAVQMTVGKGLTTTSITGVPTDPAVGVAYTLTATVAGSVAGSSSASMTRSTVVTRGKTTISRVHPSATTASSGPTGNVQFMNGTTYLGTAATTNGVATYSGTATAAKNSFNAMYSGDQNYGTSSSTTKATTGLTATSTSLTASSYAVSIGQTLTFYSTVFSVGVASTQTGTVTYSATAQGVLGSGTVSGGLATLTVSSLPAGTYTMTATYSGDSAFAGSSSTSSVIVTVAAGVATLAGSFSPATVPYGSDAVLTATASFAATSIGGPSGTLVAKIAGVTGATYTQTLAASTTSPSSVAVFTFPAPPPGVYTVTVSCPAADVFSCAGPVAIPFTVVRGGTTTALTLTPPGPLAGQPVTITATIRNAGDDTRAYTFTGTVQFFANNQLLGTGTVSGVTASISAALPAGAAESINAVYSGDVDWTTSISTPVAITVAALPTTIVVSSNVSSALSGVQVELTATVTNIAGGPLATTAPTGSVSFYDTYEGVVSLLGLAKLVSQGANTSIATLIATGLSTGAHKVYAVYLGDTIYMGSTSPAITLGLTSYTVTFVPTTLTLKQGQTGLASLVVNFESGFGGSVSFGCTPPPNVQLICSFSPAVLTASGTTTLNVGTVLAQDDKRSGQSSEATQHSPLGGLAEGAVMAMLLFCIRSKRRLPGLLLALVLAGSISVIGCTGTNVTSSSTTIPPPVTTPSTPGTSLGTQVLTITTAGSDGTNTVRHDFQYQVTVQ